MAGGHERLCERLERADLGEISAPGLEIRLRRQPAVEDGIGVRRSGTGGDDAGKNCDKKQPAQCGNIQLRTSTNECPTGLCFGCWTLEIGSWISSHWGFCFHTGTK